MTIQKMRICDVCGYKCEQDLSSYDKHWISIKIEKFSVFGDSRIIDVCTHKCLYKFIDDFKNAIEHSE